MWRTTGTWVWVVEGKLEAELLVAEKKLEMEKAAVSSTTKLPKLKITTFKDTAGDWVSFKKMFLMQVDAKYISDEERFRNLVESVSQKFVSLITTFQGFKKALNVLGFNSEQQMSENCAHHFAGMYLAPNMSYRWWHDWMGHHNGSLYYPGCFLRPPWYISWNKKEKDKVLSHLIEIAKVYRAFIHVRQVMKTLIMMTQLFAERNLQIF